MQHRWRAERIDLRGAIARHRRVHQRDDHPEIDPVGNAVRQQERCDGEVYAQAETQVDYIILDGWNPEQCTVPLEDLAASGKVDVRMGESKLHVVEVHAAEGLELQAASR